MIKIPLYGDKKLITAFEYGLMLGDVAKGLKIKVSNEIADKLEKIILKEFKTKGWKQLSGEMGYNILAALEPEEKK